MDSHNACFFCCKNIEYYSPNYGDNGNDLEEETELGETNSLIESESVNQSILQISHYLKVPRTQLDLLKNADQDNPSSAIVFCKECREISENLNVLCRDMEATKMKISYHLNLLTNRIPGNDEQQQIKQEVQLTELQKIVHQKCLLKAQKHQEKATLQVHLTKCPVGSPKSPQLSSEESEGKNYPLILEVDENQVKTELSADNDNQEMHSCPFCDYTVNCRDQLQSHIDHQHSEQFESYTTINSTTNKQTHMDAVHLKVKCKKRVKKCQICGAMVKSTNLAQHKKVHHNYKLQLKDSPEHHLKCEYCPLTFINTWNKDRHVQGAHLGKGGQSSGRMKRCEICGAMVASKNLSTHKKRRHKDVLNIGEVEKVKKFECDKCGICYGFNGSLWRHLKYSKTCGENRMGKKLEKRVKRESDPNEEEKIMKISIENEEGFEEDPLQI